MAAGPGEDDDRSMTETPQQDRVDTEHLRDYSELRRSVTDRRWAGVAGGLGKHLNIDPTILRVAFVVLAFFGGAGILLYGALWLLVPLEGRDDAVVNTNPRVRNAVLAAVAVLAALIAVGGSWGRTGWFPWPLALVGLVVVLVLVLVNREKPMSTTYPPPDSQPDSQPGSPQPETWHGEGERTTVLPPGTTGDPYRGAAPPTVPAYPVQQPPAPRPERGPLLFWFTVALVAVALGTLGLYDVAGGSVVDAAYPALALTVIGVMLVVGAWFGRAGGLILLGLVTTIALLATSVAHPRFSGERNLDATPASAVQVHDRYFVPAGSVELDLSHIRDVRRLDGRTVDVRANAGDIVVVLPKGVDVDVDANVSMAGQTNVLGETRQGTGPSIHQVVDGGPHAPHMNLNVDLVVGSIEVRQ